MSDFIEMSLEEQNEMNEVDRFESSILDTTDFKLIDEEEDDVFL